MSKNLKNKVCFLTGANRGIGSAILKNFVEEGAVVYANARTEGSIDASLYPADHKNIVPVYFDIRDTDAVAKVFSRIWKEQGKLDVMVNNAGIVKDAFIGMIGRKSMEDTFETNVYCQIELLQYATKLMKKRNVGSIIILASVVGIYGNQGQTVYSASKGAVISATKSAAKELASYGIRVNAIAPGMIDTDMLAAVGEDKKKEYLEKIGMGRFGKADDIAKVCVMLASDYTEYMTGQVIEVSGMLSL